MEPVEVTPPESSTKLLNLKQSSQTTLPDIDTYLREYHRQYPELFPMEQNPSAVVEYDEEFHSAQSSPVFHRHPASSTRVPSPLSIDRLYDSPNVPSLAAPHDSHLVPKQQRRNDFLAPALQTIKPLPTPTALPTTTILAASSLDQQVDQQNSYRSIKRKSVQRVDNGSLPHPTNPSSTLQPNDGIRRESFASYRERAKHEKEIRHEPQVEEPVRSILPPTTPPAQSQHWTMPRPNRKRVGNENKVAQREIPNSTGPSLKQQDFRRSSWENEVRRVRNLPKPPLGNLEVPSNKELDEAQDFDIAELDAEDNQPLPSHIAKHLQEVAQQYFPKPVGREVPPFQNSTATPLRPPSPKLRKFGLRKESRSASDTAKHKRSQTNDVVAGDVSNNFNESHFCCQDAESLSATNDLNLSFCYECGITYCTNCWLDQLPHKRNRPGHEKVNAAVARMIEKTLEIRVSEIEQAELHLLDESASWFGAIHNHDGVVFRDFGRYASLMSEHSLADKKSCYPALVSFVGDTGAGKSSLIKLLVGVKNTETSKGEKKPTQTPVVGNNGATTPTSGDVHLYADPETFLTERPLLYADCEGLRGGTLEPIGARRRRKLYSGRQIRSRTASFDKHIRRRHETAEREIVWATTSERTTRKYFVEHLYPRLLYTFSDVIVFVVKNARMIEDVMEQLIVWADAVIETASNQPVLPHAIIVLNASDNQDAKLWNVDASTNALLDAMSQAVDVNPKLRSFAAKWNQRGFNINSVQSLLLAYYSSIRVLRIPERSQPSLIHDQIQQLYIEIGNQVTESHHVKHQKRLKLNAEALQPYLQQAFDHFCRDLNDPFDFIKASFADNGIPSDFCGNTLKLAVDIMSHWSNRIDGALLFRELSFIVASCVMLDAVRRQKLGFDGAIFKEYIDHFDETLDDFCEKVWPCEFVSQRGRCVNVRAGHTKGHQLSKGQRIAGEYQSSFSAQSHRQIYRRQIFANLQELLARLSKDTGEARGEQQAAARIHESTILGPFYRHLGGARHFVSHSACLSCLVAPAEHCLPCGHVLCTPCIKDFGRSRGHCAIEMAFCPLHKQDTRGWRHEVALKPENAGTRVLSMDGGGIRGILLLMTLQELERDLCGMPVQMFFDLMIGTSTGGLIALGLGEMGWTVAQSLEKFQAFAAAAFQKHRLASAEYLEWLVAGYQGGRYKTEPLEEILISQYTERNLFGGVRNDLGSSARNHITCKVGVTATSLGGTPFLLTNYNRDYKTGSGRYSFLRAEKPVQEISVWEAARATCAAPRIFKPYNHAASGQTFIDGGVYYNNPIEVALQENALIWPQSRPRLPDLMLSLGTGYSERKKSLLTTPGPVGKDALKIVSYYKQLLKIAVDHVKSSQRSEDEFRRIRQPYNTEQAEICFRRFNMLFPDDFVSLKPDRVENMPYMRDFGRLELDDRKEEIRNIANRLIATSFYFEPLPGSIQSDGDWSITLQGTIRCRFQQHSQALRYLGDVLRSRIQEAVNVPGGTRHTPCFVIEDRSRPRDAEQVKITSGVLSTMQDYGQLNLGPPIKISAANLHLGTDIHLRFGGEGDWDDHNSISGFPRSWESDSITKHKPSTLKLNEARTRLPSRRGRPEWTEPTSRLVPMLGQYAEVRNIGMATDDQLSAIETRLTSPAPAQMQPSELAVDVETAWAPDRKSISGNTGSGTAPLSSAPLLLAATPQGSKPPAYARQTHLVELPGDFYYELPESRRPPTLHPSTMLQSASAQASPATRFANLRLGQRSRAGDEGHDDERETSDMYGSG